MHDRGPARVGMSVLDALGHLDEDGLATLLGARPDLNDPPPRSMVELAARAAGQESFEACMGTLDLGCRQVYEALCLLDGPPTVERLAALLSVDEDDSDLAEVVRRLVERVLIVRQGDRLYVLPGLEVRYPAGLGPPAAIALAPQSAPALAAMAQRLGHKAGSTKAATLAVIAAALSEPGRVSRLLAKAPRDVADLARRLASDGPEGYTGGTVYGGDKTSAGWLANRGVVAPRGWDGVVLVREAGLAIRGGMVFPTLALRPPDLAVQPVDGATVDRAAAERGLTLVADISVILDGWSTDGPRQLKAGGLGIQSVRRAAKAVDRSEVETARVIELAAAAGLVSLDAVSDSALPLPAYDDWSDLPVAGRWSHLVAAWMVWDLHPSVAGALGEKRKPIPPLLVRAPEPHARARRGRILATLAAAAPGNAVVPGSVHEHALWDAPALWGGGPGPPAMLASWTMAECELLGLCGLGALSTWGRMAAEGDMEGAQAALARLVPAATRQFVVQPDLTALAPAELVRSVQAELHSMADLESRGAAALYRFTEASLRRAFEAGRTAADILAFLEAYSSKGVPQALAYLVNDVGRRFGQLRVASIACCLRSDDPSLLAEAVASRSARGLGLRLLAPTVAASTADAAAVLVALRGAGYLPAEEGPGGALVVSRPAPRRAVPDPRLVALGRRRPGQTAGFGPVGRLFGAAPGATKAAIVAGATAPAGATGAGDGMSPAAVAARLVGASSKGGASPKRSVPQRSVPRGSVPKRPIPPPSILPRSGPAAPIGSSPVASPPTYTLFDVGPAGCRPERIARDPDAVADLLHQALVDDWPVRLAYTNKKGRTTQLNGTVLDVGDVDVVVGLLSGWENRVLALGRIGWARVLTEAEEDAL